MQHEPCRLLGDFHIARNLVTTHAVFTVGQHPCNREPLIKADRRVLKDRSNLDGEFAARMVASALPSAALRIDTDPRRAAPGANNTIRPAASREIVNAVRLTCKVENRFLKALRFFDHVTHLLIRKYQILMGESSKLLP